MAMGGPPCLAAQRILPLIRELWHSHAMGKQAEPVVSPSRLRFLSHDMSV